MLQYVLHVPGHETSLPLHADSPGSSGFSCDPAVANAPNAKTVDATARMSEREITFIVNISVESACKPWPSAERVCAVPCLQLRMFRSGNDYR